MNWNWIQITGVLTYLIGIVALFVIPANRKPGEATAWLLLMFVAPILGLILFLLLGSPKLSQWRRAQQRAMNERIKHLAEEAEQIPELRTIVDPLVPARRHRQRDRAGEGAADARGRHPADEAGA